MRVCALVFAGLFAWPALAQEGAADRARTALSMMDTAAAQLEKADSARDRVHALTSVIQAYEEGMNALRTSLRQTELRATELSGDLAAREAEIATLLLALQRAGNRDAPVYLLHPGGPEASLRAGLLLSQVTPVLSARAGQLRSHLEELEAIQAVQIDAATTLQSGLETLQNARASLNQAIADRAPLPKRFLADPVREAILISSAETLDAFASGLDELSAQTIASPPPALENTPPGSLALPVQGRVLRNANEADAAGITRPGLLVAADAQALVVSPVPATLRYVGPLLDFGEVVILEPQADILFVFAGLGSAFVETGDVVEAGVPLGLMGTASQKSAIVAPIESDEAGAARPETLYIEVRQNNTPEDPSLWFRTDKDG